MLVLNNLSTKKSTAFLCKALEKLFIQCKERVNMLTIFSEDPSCFVWKLKKEYTKQEGIERGR